MARIQFDITGDNRNVLEAFKGVQKGVRETQSVVEQSGQSIEAIFKRIQSAAAMTFAGVSAKQFVDNVMKVRGEFQQLEVAFTTMLQSEEKASDLMNQLVKTAAITPFDLKGVAGSAKQLLAYGIAAEEVNDTLIHLGDIAAGLSIPLGDLVYLYGTTMVQGRMFTMDLRQFQGRGVPLAEELAKQFGVAKDKVGELVSAGKVGAEDFKKAIMSMSSEGGKFGGLMEKQSKTISGQISNIEDAIDVMFNEIGKSSEGAINTGLSGVALLVENWEAVGKAILAAAEAYGIYKATLMTMAAYDSAAMKIGYDAEIAALQEVIPLKEQAAATDLEQAVASGKLTEEKAAMIAALRAEAEAHIELLATKEAQAKAAFDAATAEAAEASVALDAAQEQYDAMQTAYEQAVALGDAKGIETAAEQLNTAEIELNTAASTHNSAQKKVSAASTELEAASKAKNTAATQLETAMNAADTASTGILAQAKLALKRAIDALNASFLASPLFWIAATITAVTFGIYKLATAMSDAEKANKKWSDASKEIQANVASERAEIDRLFEKLRSAREGTDKYKQAKEAIISQYGKYLNGLNEEVRTLKNVEEAYKAVTKAAREASIARGKEAALKDVQDSYGKAYSDNMQKLQEALYEKAGGKQATAALDQIQNELRKTGTISEETEQKVKNLLRGTQDYGNASAWITGLRNNEQRLKEYTRNVEERFKLEEEVAEQKKVRDKAAIEQEKKNLLSDLEALTAAEANGEKGIAIKKKIQALDKELEAYSTKQSKTKADSQFKELRNDSRYHEMLLEQKRQHGRDVVDLYFSTAQAEIDAMEDGSDKTMRQIQLDFDKRKEEITRAYEDLKQKKIEEAQKLWEANPANKNKVFDKSTVDTSYTDEEEENYQKRLKANEAERQRREKEIAKQHLQSMRDYLKQYGNELQQELAITEDYQEKIDEARKQGDEGRALMLEKQLQEELSNSKLTRLRNSPEYIRAFEDLGNTSSETLKMLIKSFEDAKEAAAKSLEPHQLKEYSDTLQRMYDELDSRNPFDTLVKSLKELAKAQEEVDAAQKIYDDVKAGKVVLNVETGTAWTETEASKNLSAAKDKEAKIYTTLTKASQKCSETMKSFANTLNDLGSKIGGKLGDSLGAVGGILGSLGDAYGSIKNFNINATGFEKAIGQFSAVAGTVSAMIDMNMMLDSILPDQQSLYEHYAAKQREINEQHRKMLELEIEQLQQRLNQESWFYSNGLTQLRMNAQLNAEYLKAYGEIAAAPQEIYKNAGSGFSKWAPAIIGAIVGVIAGIFTFGAGAGPGAALGAAIGSAIGGTAIGAALGSTVIALVGTAIFSGVGAALGNAVRAGVDGITYKEGQTAAINNLRVQTRHKTFFRSEKTQDLQSWVKENWGQDLFEEIKGVSLIDREVAKKLLEDGPTLVGETRETLEQLLEYSEKIHEFLDQVHEYVSDAFSPLVDNLTDALFDWLENGKDVLKSFREYAADTFKNIAKDALKAMITKNIFEPFQEQLEDMVIAFSTGQIDEKGFMAGVSEFALQAQSAIQTQLPMLQDAAKVIEIAMQNAGIDITGGTYSQQASSRGFQAMGQDAGEELNGRFTALQIAGEGIYQQITIVVASLNAITSFSQQNNTAVLEIRNMMIMTNSYLEDMVKYAKLMYNDVGSKLDTIASNTKNL